MQIFSCRISTSEHLNEVCAVFEQAEMATLLAIAPTFVADELSTVTSPWPIS